MVITFADMVSGEIKSASYVVDDVNYVCAHNVKSNGRPLIKHFAIGKMRLCQPVTSSLTLDEASTWSAWVNSM